MPSELHEKMVSMCKARLPAVLDSKEQMRIARKEHNRKQLIPDLITRDRNLAVECCALNKDTLHRLHRYSEQFRDLILVFPFFGNIRGLWLYNPSENKLYTFIPDFDGAYRFEPKEEKENKGG